MIRIRCYIVETDLVAAIFPKTFPTLMHTGRGVRCEIEAPLPAPLRTTKERMEEEISTKENRKKYQCQ